MCFPPDQYLICALTALTDSQRWICSLRLASQPSDSIAQCSDGCWCWWGTPPPSMGLALWHLKESWCQLVNVTVRSECEPGPFQEHSNNNNHTPGPGLYHAWLVFHSAERHGRLVKLPALFGAKPKNNHYGCPIRACGDYGMAKWLLGGIKLKYWGFLPGRIKPQGMSTPACRWQHYRRSAHQALHSEPLLLAWDRHIRMQLPCVDRHSRHALQVDVKFERMLVLIWVETHIWGSSRISLCYGKLCNRY